MKHIERTRAGKKVLLLIVLAAVLVLLLATYFIVRAVTKNAPEPEPEPEVLPTVDSEIGETIINNEAAAYAQIASEDLLDIAISHPAGTPESPKVADYSLTRLEEMNNSFVLSYEDESGELLTYLPAIVAEDGSFSYDSLYATEALGDYGSIPRTSYLASAIGARYFDTRIDFAEGDEERKAQFERFGLDHASAVEVVFYFRKADGGIGTHTLLIGGNAISGKGYYFTVDDRPYIYYSSSDYLAYAVQPVEYYINPRIIAEGLAADNAFEPYLTPRFEQYRNTLHKAAEEAITADAANVIVRAKTDTPIAGGAKLSSPSADGYYTARAELLTLRMSNERVRSVLTGKTVGSYAEAPLFLTVSQGMLPLDFGDRESVTAVYHIGAIEAILGEDGEIRAAGTPVGDADRLTVSYTAEIDGVELSDHEDAISGGLLPISLPMHAILDLSDPLVPEEIGTALRAATVGSPLDLSFTVVYTKDNAESHEVEERLVEIISIITAAGKSAAAVSDGCTVNYSYRTVVDGVVGEELLYAAIKVDAAAEDAYARSVSTALLGRKAGLVSKNVALYAETGYGECLEDFVRYEIDAIEGFLTSEQVVSFAFANASERDPYYGETFYKNTMESSYRLYGLNTSSCEAVIRKLGGLNVSSSASVGITGIETVRVGLSEEVFLQYGLYAYTVVFDLPRGIGVRSSTDYDSDALDDYTWKNVLSFTLRVSEKFYEDGGWRRYVSSDMFNLVAKVDADEFLFLDYDFLSFYARNTLIMMNVDNVDYIDVTFNMDDLTGSYAFDFLHAFRYVWIDETGTRIEKEPPEGGGATYRDVPNVKVTPLGEGTPNALTEFLAEHGYDFVSLYEFYDSQIASGGIDNLGTACFKAVFQMIYSTSYENVLSEENLAAVAGEPILRLSLGVVGQDAPYIYEFFRVSDRRVAVRLSHAGDTATAFYVSTFTCRRYIAAFLAVLNRLDYRSEDVYAAIR